MSKVVENYILQDEIKTIDNSIYYKAIHTQTKEPYLIIMLNAQQFQKNARLQEQTIYEVQSLKKLQHPNIMKFYKLLKTNNHIYIVKEYLTGATLSEIYSLAKTGSGTTTQPANTRHAPPTTFKEQELKHIIGQLLSALAHMQERKIVHGNLQASNIVIGRESLDVRIIGFEYSRNAESDSLKINGDQIQNIYCAPEVLQEHTIGLKCDIYSLGILIIELLVGIDEVKHLSNEDQLYWKQSMQFQYLLPPAGVAPKLQQLLTGMLKADVNARLDARQAQQSFAQVEEFYSPSIALLQQQPPVGSYTSSNKQEEAISPASSQDRGEDALMLQLQDIHKYMVRERNKIMFLGSVVQQVLLIFDSPAGVKLMLIFLKLMNALSDVQQCLLASEGAPSRFAHVAWDKYRRSNDGLIFGKIYKQEAQKINDSFDQMRNLYTRIAGAQHPLEQELQQLEIQDEEFIQNYVQQFANLQLERAKVQHSEGDSNKSLSKRLLLATNNILDGLDVQRFFDKCMPSHHSRHIHTYSKRLKELDFATVYDIVCSKLVQ